MIDPAVFTDEDGQSYLYWGNDNSYQVPLGDDMVSFDAAQVRTYHPANYNEGSFVVKRDGRATRRSARGASVRASSCRRTSRSASRAPATTRWSRCRAQTSGTSSTTASRSPVATARTGETAIDRLDFDAGGAIEKVVPTLAGIDPVVTVTDGRGGRASATVRHAVVIAR